MNYTSYINILYRIIRSFRRFMDACPLAGGGGYAASVTHVWCGVIQTPSGGSKEKMELSKYKLERQNLSSEWWVSHAIPETWVKRPYFTNHLKSDPKNLNMQLKRMAPKMSWLLDMSLVWSWTRRKCFYTPDRTSPSESAWGIIWTLPALPKKVASLATKRLGTA